MREFALASISILMMPARNPATPPKRPANEVRRISACLASLRREVQSYTSVCCVRYKPPTIAP